MGEGRKDKLEKHKDETQGREVGPDDVTATSGPMTEEEIGGGAAVRRKLNWSELSARRAEHLPASVCMVKHGYRNSRASENSQRPMRKGEGYWIAVTPG